MQVRLHRSNGQPCSQLSRLGDLGVRYIEAGVDMHGGEEGW